MGGICRFVRGSRPLMAWALVWAVYIFIWVIWGWAESEPFNEAWWFDAGGHYTALSLAVFNMIHFYKRYRIGGVVLLSQNSSTMAWILITAILLGIAHEFAEWSWDSYFQPNFFPHLAKAQKGQIDTLLDLVFNFAGALFTLRLYCWYEMRFYTRFYREQINEAEIVAEMQEIKRRARILKEKIKRGKKEYRKQRYRELRNALRELFPKRHHNKAA